MTEVTTISKPKASTPPKTVRIQLEENDAIPPTGQFIGVNGKGYLLKPGVEVDVPMGVVEALDNASFAAPVFEPGTQRIIGWSERLRFPYRVIRKRAASEVQ